MKKYVIILLSISIVILSCKKDKKQEEAQLPPISDLFEAYYEDGLKLNPLMATFAGDNRYNDQLPNFITKAYQNKEKAYFTDYKAKLEAYDRSTLTETDQISYDILNWECDINLEAFNYPTELLPINQLASLPQFIGQLAGGKSLQPFQTVEDYKNWLKRLDHYVAWCDTAVVTMRKGIKEGYVLPKTLIVKVIPQLSAFSNGPAEEHLFFKPVNDLPDSFSETEKEELSNAYKTMIEEKIIPTYKALETFFKEEYMPAGRETSGIAVLPGGAEYYNFQIKLFTTTTMSADEIHQIGLDEVARIEAEMEKVKAEVGFEGTLKEFFDHVRTKKELMPFTEPEQVIANFNAIHEKMKPHLEKLFDLVPKTAFEVRRTEAFREASASAQYTPGSLDGTRPGIFYVPIPNVEEYNTYTDEDLFLHEAIPGHHYQISLQRENTTLPDFRKSLIYSAYAEGWALYTESLGKELGLYEDPYQYFGMLSAEMHRAIRLVVDTGIHTKGWTREEAIQYSLDHEAEPEASIISEIERYMAVPGQALSYKIGQLKIRELRSKAEEKLGDAFDIREFHNIILESGAQPLKLIEEKVNRWIASKE